MKLLTEARCAVYGTIHGTADELVTIISIRGNMAIVRALNGERFPIRYDALTCPLTPDNYRPTTPQQKPEIQDPVKTKKKQSSKTKPDGLNRPVQKTLF